MEAVITTIQRMSLHDGPGIRSVLFLKGCNMRCRWCHNPETWVRTTQLQQIRGRCVGCGSCLEACPPKALRHSENGIRIERGECTVCGRCAEVCPSGALSLVGERIDAREALRRVERDRVFFDQTGGGVTLSGGEPLLQADFAEEFLGLCRKAGISTAVESNLSLPWDRVERLTDSTDLWMCDLKIADPELHRRMTDTDNGPVVENLGRLLSTGARVIVRTPVIPGVNDTRRQIEALCRTLRPYEERLAGYELLPFHTLGFDKFANYGADNPLAGCRDLPRERFESLRSIARTLLKITK